MQHLTTAIPGVSVPRVDDRGSKPTQIVMPRSTISMVSTWDR